MLMAHPRNRMGRKSAPFKKSDSHRDLRLTRRGRRARLSAKGKPITEIPVGIHAPLDLLEFSKRICSLTPAIELLILQRLAGSLSI
jgi:hypothetical protein